MYGQLINGTLESAPKKVDYQENIIYNPPGEIYEALGYYMVVYSEMPKDAPDGYHYESCWEQVESEIIQKWTLAENDDEISNEEALAIILGGIE